jgi:hypothetical protein
MIMRYRILASLIATAGLRRRSPGRLQASRGNRGLQTKCWSRHGAGNCTACHSADYIKTQPRGEKFKKDFWAAEVTKMIKVYGAPIDDADVGKIVDYPPRITEAKPPGAHGGFAEIAGRDGPVVERPLPPAPPSAGRSGRARLPRFRRVK